LRQLAHFLADLAQAGGHGGIAYQIGQALGRHSKLQEFSFPVNWSRRHLRSPS
jgi:hypothetical protein